MTHFLTPRYDGILLLILFFYCVIIIWTLLHCALYIWRKKRADLVQGTVAAKSMHPNSNFSGISMSSAERFWRPRLLLLFFLLIWIFFLVFIFDINWLPVMLVYSTSFFGSLTHQREVKLLFETLYFGSKNWDNDKNISDNVMFTNANWYLPIEDYS